MIKTIILALIFGYIVTDIFFTVRNEKSRIKFLKQIYGQITLRIFGECVAVLAFALVVSIWLFDRFPLLSYGWLGLVTGQSGNILLAPVVEASESGVRWLEISALILVTALIPVLPFLARWEEEVFRRSCISLGGIVRSSLIFGPVHLFMGIPIGSALALTLIGFFYGYKFYKSYHRLIPNHTDKEARDLSVLHTTACHTTCNTIITVVLFLIITGQITGHIILGA